LGGGVEDNSRGRDEDDEETGDEVSSCDAYGHILAI